MACRILLYRMKAFLSTISLRESQNPIASLYMVLEFIFNKIPDTDSNTSPVHMGWTPPVSNNSSSSHSSRRSSNSSSSHSSRQTSNSSRSHNSRRSSNSPRSYNSRRSSNSSSRTNSTGSQRSNISNNLSSIPENATVTTRFVHIPMVLNNRNHRRNNMEGSNTNYSNSGSKVNLTIPNTYKVNLLEYIHVLQNKYTILNYKAHCHELGKVFGKLLGKMKPRKILEAIRRQKDFDTYYMTNNSESKRKKVETFMKCFNAAALSGLGYS